MAYNGPLPQAVKAGGTAVSSVTIAPTATSFAGWDANKNLSAFNILDGYTTTATAASTTTLTVGSTGQQFFTGSTTQTVHLPVASTLVLGQAYYIVNNSTGVVTVESSGGNTIKAMAASTWAIFTCILTSGTTAASWNVEYGQSTGGVETITGDTGSPITGSSLTIYANNASQICGATALFVNSGTVSTLNVTDTNENTLIGLNAGGNTIAGAAHCTGLGFIALNSITTDTYCTAVGSFCLDNVGGTTSNTGLGYNVGSSLTSGGYNTLLGANSGQNYTNAESSNIIIAHSGVAAENNVLRIGAATGTGSQELNAAYISGINGISVTGTAVIVSASDQLGITVSSRKYKSNIKDMDEYSESILDLRPVTFNPKGDQETICPGLIAEEVAEVMPNLVVYDKNGDPQTVKYHELPALLLNELKKALARIEKLESKI